MAARVQSAGVLLYRDAAECREVLLVHPSGSYNRRTPWGIPKGLVDADEPLEQCARRELLEETGLAARELVPLGYADYRKSRKRIHCFAGPAEPHAAPRCASWEVDRAEFVAVPRAFELIHPDQAVFLERLEQYLRGEE